MPEYLSTISPKDSPAELIGFAGRLDPGLPQRQFTDAVQQRDQADDEASAWA
jgi:hypothetical protein